MANTKFELILEMLFLKLSNADVLFDEGTLTWKSYTINKVLSTTEQVQLIDSQEFVIAALNVDNETFVVYIDIQEQEKMPMYSERRAHIQNEA